MNEELRKKCSKCGELKLLGSFYNRADCQYGVDAKCKQCVSEIQKASRERINAARRKRELLDPEGEAEKKRRSRENTKEADKARVAKWRKENPLAVSSQATEWRKQNPDAAAEISKRYNRKKRSTAKGRLEANVSRGVHRGLTRGSKAGNKTFDILPYSVDDLMIHLEGLFVEGMSWGNYGDWHVDHKIPLVAFNYESTADIDFQRAWSLRNLQPMWASDNHSKGGKLLTSFQPSLLLQVALS